MSFLTVVWHGLWIARNRLLPALVSDTGTRIGVILAVLPCIEPHPLGEARWWKR